jgi:hypothetical protein
MITGLDRRALGRRRSAAACFLQPDMASLATGSVNFLTRVYDNSPDLVDWLAADEALRHQTRGRAFDFDAFQPPRWQGRRIDGHLHVQLGWREERCRSTATLSSSTSDAARLSPGAT